MSYAKALIGISSLGALNALYLTVLFVRTKTREAASSFCDFSSSVTCTGVITSPYALFLGVPVCTIALVVYPVLIGLGFAAVNRTKTRDVFFAASLLSAMGLMLNVVYVYNEVVHIHSLCVLCIACTFLILLDLIASVLGYARSSE